jgi:hypothetical protein
MTGDLGSQSTVFQGPPAASSASSGTPELGPSRAEKPDKSAVIRCLFTTNRYIYGTAGIIRSPAAAAAYRSCLKSNNPPYINNSEALWCLRHDQPVGNTDVQGRWLRTSGESSYSARRERHQSRAITALPSG